MRDDATHMLGGHDADDDVGFEDGIRKIVGDMDVDRENISGKVGEILTAITELLGEFGRVGPETETMASAAGKRDG